MSSYLLNPGFETGTLENWSGQNASVSAGISHQGYFRAELQGGGLNSYIYQNFFIAGNNGQLSIALAKTSALPSPSISITVQFFEADMTLIGYGLIENVQADGLPIATPQTWKQVYATTPINVPAIADTATIVINALPAAGTSNVLVDDVKLIFI